MANIIRSNWTDRELELLCDPSNHKIVSDGYNWIWKHKISSKWELHSIKVFETYERPIEWLHWNLASWKKELNARRVKQARQSRSSAREIKRVIDAYEWELNKKVLEIHRLNPNLTMREIGLMLGVSRQTIHNHLNTAA